MMTDDKGKVDAREFYRLDQVIGVSAQWLNPQHFSASVTDTYDKRLGVPPILSLLNQSRENQIDNGQLLKQIRGRSNHVGRYLERMNERLDLLQQAILYIDQSFPKLSWQFASYSEAGTDFLIPHKNSPYRSPLIQHHDAGDTDPALIQLQDQLHLILAIAPSDFIDNSDDIILPETHFVYHPHFAPAGYVSILARAASVQAEKDYYRIGCEFEYMTDFDRQFLARHILAVQSFRRRQALSEQD